MSDHRDCEHGYFDGTGCGICGTPIKQRDERIKELEAEVERLRELIDLAPKAEQGGADRGLGIGGDKGMTEEEEISERFHRETRPKAEPGEGAKP